MLLVVSDKVPELLLAALQCGIQLLHLVHQVGFLRLETLSVGLHGCDKKEKEIFLSYWIVFGGVRTRLLTSLCEKELDVYGRKSSRVASRREHYT